MKKLENLITIGTVSIMALSFTACEKDSDDSKLVHIQVKQKLIRK